MAGRGKKTERFRGISLGGGCVGDECVVSQGTCGDLATECHVLRGALLSRLGLSVGITAGNPGNPPVRGHGEDSLLCDYQLRPHDIAGYRAM